MSTSGFVGIGNKTEWVGVYNNSDSYPTELGKEVWDVAVAAIQKDGDLKKFAKTLHGYDDWKQVEDGGICEYCGKKGSPYAADVYLMRSMASTKPKYPDPKQEFHKHNSPKMIQELKIRPDHINWLFMEWGYVLEPETNTMHIFKGCIRTPIQYTTTYIRDNGSRDSGSAIRFIGAYLCSVNLLSQEPDWEQIESDARDISELLATTFSRYPKHHMLDDVYLLPTEEIYDQRENGVFV